MREFLEVVDQAEEFVSSAMEGHRVPQLEEKVGRVIDLLTETKLPQHRRRYLIEEAATTSDFPLLFGNVLERTLVAKYREATADVFSYIGRGTQGDFRSQEFLSVHGGESLLGEVKERGEYKGTTISEGKLTSNIKKYGRAYPVSWESLINDNMGALSIVDRFSRAARHTENTEVTKLIADPTAPAAALFGDAVAHPLESGVTVDNLDILGLSIPNLGTIIQRMRSQTDFDGNPIVFSRFHLVVGPKLELRAYEILNSTVQLLAAAGGEATNETFIRGNINPLRNLSIIPHVNPYLPIINSTNGDDSWYLFADPVQDGPAAIMNFLRGRETPEIHLKASDKMVPGGGIASPLEGDFWHDTVFVRVRHMMGGVALDPRRCYVNTGGLA